MICPKCGRRAEGNRNYCINCGAKLVCEEGETLEMEPAKKTFSWEKALKLAAFIVILFLAVRFVNQKLYSVEGTWCDDRGEELTFKDGTLYEDDMALCTYDQKNETIRFHTRDGIYYGTYSRKEKALYVDGEIFYRK